MRSALAVATITVMTTLLSCAPRSVGRELSGEPLLPSLQVYTGGEEVHLVLQVTNTSTVPEPLEFSSGQTHDFVVRQGERELWRWSDGQAFTQAEREEMLAAGESLTFEAVWRPPNTTRGDFVAIGRLLAEDRQVEQATRFALP